MSKDLNLCQFIGRLGQAPEIKYMPSGKAVANISIACGDDYKNKESGQMVERTEWIRVVAFGRLAEIMGEYLNKGSQIHVSGKMTTRKWQDQNGQDKYTTEIVASKMQMLGGRQDGGQSSSQGYQQSASHAPVPAPAGDWDDDIPF